MIRSDSLPLLFEEALTVAVRIRAGRQPILDPDVFRAQIQNILQTAEKTAFTYGYSSEDASLAVSAVAAFLDESMLDSGHAAHASFSEGNFYDNLERLLVQADSATVADLLEIYKLCLLLGFHGNWQSADIGLLLRQVEMKIRRTWANRRAPVQHLDLALLPDAHRLPPAVFLVGEAGAGKTSLIAEARSSAMTAANETLWIERSPLRKGTPSPTVMVLDCEAFLEPERLETLAQIARSYRQAVADREIYVVFTKADKIAYFSDFAKNFTGLEAREVLGASVQTTIGEAFEHVYRSFLEKRVRLLAREADPALLPNIFEFPREFAKLRPLVIEFLTELRAPVLRGFYFTGMATIQYGSKPQQVGAERLLAQITPPRKWPGRARIHAMSA